MYSPLEMIYSIRKFLCTCYNKSSEFLVALNQLVYHKSQGSSHSGRHTLGGVLMQIQYSALSYAVHTFPSTTCAVNPVVHSTLHINQYIPQRKGDDAEQNSISGNLAPTKIDC